MPITWPVVAFYAGGEGAYEAFEVRPDGTHACPFNTDLRLDVRSPDDRHQRRALARARSHVRGDPDVRVVPAVVDGDVLVLRAGVVLGSGVGFGHWVLDSRLVFVADGYVRVHVTYEYRAAGQPTQPVEDCGTYHVARKARGWRRVPETDRTVQAERAAAALLPREPPF